MHGNFASYLFKTHLDEDSKQDKAINRDHLYASILSLTSEIIGHEDSIIEYTFGAEASINDITKDNLKTFIRSRANEVLVMLGYAPIYVVGANPIASWFYKGANSIKMHDFFVSGTNQYRRSWALDSFSRLPHLTQEIEVDTGKQDYLHEGRG